MGFKRGELNVGNIPVIVFFLNGVFICVQTKHFLMKKAIFI